MMVLNEVAVFGGTVVTDFMETVLTVVTVIFATLVVFVVVRKTVVGLIEVIVLTMVLVDTFNVVVVASAGSGKPANNVPRLHSSRNLLKVYK
jgi:hypothetical protein